MFLEMFSIMDYLFLRKCIGAKLMCPDLLRLPGCARNPHVGSCIHVVKINSGWLEAQLVLRGTLIPYSAADDLVTVEGITSGDCPRAGPIPMIDLSDSESVEGLLAQRIGLGVSIEEVLVCPSKTQR
ncbi:hypothetical protein M9H77_18555 [Catharanthus roseus]|uniref:Uncharacterized protein n=1 Tax=Catharanthus roseus TaxID=4058 RepID=A0ACC0B7S4_CATRO|nr:hypothetical protein M9H77_18555 [Catharanthus roseus]